MAADGAGLLSLGLNALGQYRSRPYRANSHLARLVSQCWQVPVETCACVSEPLAAMLDRYLPERAKAAAEAGLDPASVLIGLWSIASQCQANEKAIVEQFTAAQATRARDAQARPKPADQAPTVDPGQAVEDALSFDQLDFSEVGAEVAA